MWWYLFAEDWNGISMFWDVSKNTADVTVMSDASGSWGCGAFWKCIPTSENVLCYFAACPGQQNLSASTIRTYLLGIRQMHIAGGFPDPLIDHMPRLRQVLKGIKVQTAKLGKPTRTHLPVTPSILRKLKSIWLSSNPSYDDLMLWAASVTTFFTFCRSGEITVENEKHYDPKVHLSYSDIAADSSASPNVTSLNIKQSKTDQLRKGVKVVIGRTNDDLCPVSALLSYLSHWGNFPGTLFCWQNKTPHKVCEPCETRTAKSQPSG